MSRRHEAGAKGTHGVSLMRPAPKLDHTIALTLLTQCPRSIRRHDLPAISSGQKLYFTIVAMSLFGDVWSAVRTEELHFWQSDWITFLIYCCRNQMWLPYCLYEIAELRWTRCNLVFACLSNLTKLLGNLCEIFANLVIIVATMYRSVKSVNIDWFWSINRAKQTHSLSSEIIKFWALC